jgi:hypothetical protein
MQKIDVCIGPRWEESACGFLLNIYGESYSWSQLDFIAMKKPAIP